ncbi:MAG TPA: ABC transporter ATP-binding protein [Nitrososphaerales archaeon]|nr:ABC transporter ATP-binding protein [Nitrososphaerales archaeon]
MESRFKTTNELEDFAPEVISFEKVDYSHPNGVRALSEVSLSIKQGELVAILGTNGAGKSTLVRHINALLKPTRGRVRVLGTDTKQTTSAVLSKKVGIVFQNANDQLFEDSVTAEIQFGLKNFGFSPSAIEERTKWALGTFSLDEYADRPPMELSGGEKKRLTNALVLAWDPEILILDEPTVGQDSKQKEKLSEMAVRLVQQKKTVIIVTHDVEFVWPLQPRVLLMSDGKIIGDGDSASVLGNPVLTMRSNVLQPQLVEIFSKLGFSSEIPPTVSNARDYLMKNLNWNR